MTIVTQAAALGAWVAILPAGAFVVRLLQAPRANTAHLAAAIVAGFGAVSIALLICALAGLDHPTWIGLFGWIVVVPALVAPAFRRFHWDTLRVLGDRRLLVVAPALAAIAWLYLGFPNESIYGARDEAIYTLVGLHLERGGSLALVMPAEAITYPTLFAPYFYGYSMYVPGVYRAAHGLTLQFAPLLPAWIAQLHATLGDVGLFRLNGIIGVAVLPVFYALCRMFLRRPFAVLATVVLAINAAQVWSARVNLSEPMGQLFAIGGLWFAAVALRRRTARWAIVAGILCGLAAAVRLDCLLLAPLAMVATAIVAATRRDRWPEWRTPMLTLTAAIVVAQIAAFAAVWIASAPYVRGNAPALSLIAVAWAVGAVLLAASLPFGVASDAVPRLRRLLAMTVCVAIVGLFAYAAWWRPEALPPALIDAPGSPFDHMPDFRERSLVDLAAYLGWPTLVLALGGVTMAASRTIRGRGGAHHLFVGLSLFAFLAAVIVRPMVSPDYPWAIRRFVPIAIPAAIVFAALALQALLLRFARREARLFTWALTLFAAVAFLAAQRDTLFERENRGVLPAIRDLAKTTQGADLVITHDLDPLAATLLIGFDRPVVPLRDDAAPVDATTRSFWERCKAPRRCVLLHRDAEGLGGLTLGDSQASEIIRRYIAPTFAPLAHAMTAETIRILSTPVSGTAAGAPARLVGGYRDWRVDDKGFWHDEFGPAYSSRWTNGAATLALPPSHYDSLEIVFGVPDGGSRVAVALDGQTMLDEAIPAGLQVRRFPVSADAKPRLLGLRSDTFVPKARAPTVDDRELGVSVIAVRLIDSAVPRLRSDAPLDAHRGRVAILNAGEHAPFVVRSASTRPNIAIAVQNEGGFVWPASGDLQPRESPVALGILWQRMGTSETILEQRVQFPFSLRPGERLVLAPPLDTGSLPPGDYDVRIGIVHEGVTWFGGRKEASPSVPVTIAARQ